LVDIGRDMNEGLLLRPETSRDDDDAGAKAHADDAPMTATAAAVAAPVNLILVKFIVCCACTNAMIFVYFALRPSNLGAGWKVPHRGDYQAV